MFDHHRFGRGFSLNPRRKFLLLVCLWRGLGHKLLHAKFQTSCFLRLAAGVAKVTCPNVLNSRTKICSIGRVALLVMLEADQVFLCLIWKSISYTLQICVDIWLSLYWLWITKLQNHLCRTILNSATCEARAKQIVTYMEFKAIFMNIEIISYRSIVNRYMHNDRTLIFSRIATLYLGFSDSSNLATAPSTYIHTPNPLKWGFDYPIS